MTTANDNYRSGNVDVNYPVDTTTTIKQGDILYMDTDDVKPIASNANLATFVGVAMDSYPAIDSGDITSETPINAADTIVVRRGGVFKFATVAGQSYLNGTAVYWNTDAQTVTATDPGAGNIIGYVILDPGVTTITGASGTYIDVEIKPLWPATAIPLIA